jgi:hypothetical protein
MSLAVLLQQHADILTLQSNNRLKCSITGHEIPPSLDAVQAHINGKKFKKAREWYTRDYSQYLPWVIEHKSDPTKLFCTVTRMVLNKIPTEVEKHVNGKRFLRLKKDAEDKKKGLDEASRRKAERKKEREEAAQLGIWIPDADILGDDVDSDDDVMDEESGDGDENSDSGEQDMEFDREEVSKKGKGRKAPRSKGKDDDGDDMDHEESSSEDEDWIITTEKLHAMKRNGISSGPTLSLHSQEKKATKAVKALPGKGKGAGTGADKEASAPNKNSSSSSKGGSASAAASAASTTGKRSVKQVKYSSGQKLETGAAKKRA